MSKTVERLPVAKQQYKAVVKSDSGQVSVGSGVRINSNTSDTLREMKRNFFITGRAVTVDRYHAMVMCEFTALGNI